MKKKYETQFYLVLMLFLLGLLFYQFYTSTTPSSLLSRFHQPPAKNIPSEPLTGENPQLREKIEEKDSQFQSDSDKLNQLIIENPHNFDYQEEKAENQLIHYAIPLQKLYKNFSDLQMFPNPADGGALAAFIDHRPEYRKDGNQTRLVSQRRVMVLFSMKIPPYAKRTNTIDPKNPVPNHEREYRWELSCGCVFDSQNSRIINASVEKMDVTFEKFFALVMVSCPISHLDPQNPTSITVYDQRPARIRGPHRSELLVSKLPVTYPKQPLRLHRIEACIAPIFGDISENLIEWIEYNRKMGVQHFHFYDYQANNETRHILRYYAAHYPQLVSIYNWFQTAPFVMHYNGQNLMMQDCLYRNLDHATYLMYVDVDEFINIKRGENYHQMLDYLEALPRLENSPSIPENNPPPFSMFRFRNWFFRNSCSPRPHSRQEILNHRYVDLVTQRVVWKRDELCNATDKFMARTDQTKWSRVSLVGNTMNNDFYNYLIVDPYIGGHLNHYRMSNKMHWKPTCEYTNGHLKDYSILHITQGLVDAVKSISQAIYHSPLSFEYLKTNS